MEIETEITNEQLTHKNTLQIMPKLSKHVKSFKKPRGHSGPKPGIMKK